MNKNLLKKELGQFYTTNYFYILQNLYIPHYADAPISVGSIHHAGIMIKTSTNEYHIVEYGPSGGVLRKINPNISGSTMNEESHNWTIESCDKMRSNEYDPERVKKLMDIITYGQSYDLIANNCQDIKRKILDALK